LKNNSKSTPTLGGNSSSAGAEEVENGILNKVQTPTNVISKPKPNKSKNAKL